MKASTVARVIELCVHKGADCICDAILAQVVKMLRRDRAPLGGLLVAGKSVPGISQRSSYGGRVSNFSCLSREEESWGPYFPNVGGSCYAGPRGEPH